MKSHKFWQSFTRHPGTQQDGHSRGDAHADFPYDGSSAASAFLEHGSTQKPVSATKQGMLCLMQQKSYSRTHPHVKITPEKLPGPVPAPCLASGASEPRRCGVSSSPRLPLRAFDPSAPQLPRPAAGIFAEQSQFGCKLQERASPFVVTDVLPQQRNLSLA